MVRIVLMVLMFGILIFQSPIVIFAAAEGCGADQIDVSTPEGLTETIQASLWSFRSEVWNGYIDFQNNGRYWTHWGYGRWAVEGERTVHMVNDYDPYHHYLTFSLDGQSYSGERSGDHVQIHGVLICAQYTGTPLALPTGNESAVNAIVEIYKQFANRPPDGVELNAWLAQYGSGGSIQKFRKIIKSYLKDKDHSVLDIQHYYQTHYGRVPTSTESINAWCFYDQEGLSVSESIRRDWEKK